MPYMPYKSRIFGFASAVLFATAVFAGGAVFAQRAPSPAPAVYLFWTADTYAPSDYQGKSLPVYDSWITANAVVSAGNVNPDRLVYYWWVNDVFQREATGLGKKFFRYHIDIVPPGANIVIKVSVEDETKTIDVENTAVITTASPELGFYQYNSATKKISLELRDEYSVKFGEQVGFIAKPFFFSVQKLSDLVFKWSPEGGSEIESKGADSNILNLQIPASEDAESMVSRLDLQVLNPFSDIQKESVGVTLSVGR